MVSKRALLVEADNFSAQIAGLSGFVIPFLGLALLLSCIRNAIWWVQMLPRAFLEA
jgi:hypothetical protein